MYSLCLEALYSACTEHTSNGFTKFMSNERVDTCYASHNLTKVHVSCFQQYTSNLEEVFR